MFSIFDPATPTWHEWRLEPVVSIHQDQQVLFLVSIFSLPAVCLPSPLLAPSLFFLSMNFPSFFSFHFPLTLLPHSPVHHSPSKVSCALSCVCDMRVGRRSRDIKGRHEGWQCGTVVTEERDGGVQAITDRG